MAAVVLAAAGTTAALLIREPGDSPAGGGHATSGIFTETAPWRLEIWDDSSDHGCTVSVTQTYTGKQKKVFERVYDRKSFQMQMTGQLRWESNDSGCAVAPQSGPGKATLPYSKLESGSDSVAFASPSSGKVAVSVVDYQGNDSCDVELRDAGDGQTLDSDNVASDGSSVVLDSNGRPLVYLAANSCIVRIAAG